MTQIEKKWSDLKAKGLDLGSPKGAERDAGYGGRVREYTNGTIYWHPDVMKDGEAREVHGGILARYVALGSNGPDPKTGARKFGFPAWDEMTTGVGLHRVSHFEWGSIVWMPDIGATAISGGAWQAWMASAKAGYNVGDPTADDYGAAGGSVAYCDRGLVWRGAAKPGATPMSIASMLSIPLLGQPAIVRAKSTSNQVIAGASIWADTAAALAELRSGSADLIPSLWRNRLFLRQVVPAGTAAEMIPLDVRGASTADDVPWATITDLALYLRKDVVIRERGLYDLVMKPNATDVVVLAHHAVYARDDWSHFGFMHATDLHVARRNDSYYQRLVHLGKVDAAAAFNNWNDRTRELILYANHLHDRGILDVILVTGDLADFAYEHGDRKPGPGNFGVFEQIVLGASKSPRVGAPAPEELRVPVFTIPGNHDYRPNPYRLYFDVHIPGPAEKTIEQYSGFNLRQEEARAIEEPLPHTIEYDESFAMIAIDRTMPYYSRHLSTQRSFVARLGKHRVVMLDTGPDADPIDTLQEAVKAAAGVGTENEASFQAGAPNVEGITTQHLTLLRDAVSQAGAGGLVLVGMHAPPINPKGNEFGHFFRETEHPVVPPEHVTAYVIRNAHPELGIVTTLLEKGKEFLDKALDVAGDFLSDITGGLFGGGSSAPIDLSKVNPNWVRTGTPHFKVGSRHDMLDVGSTAGETDRALEIFAGVNAPRKVDLVLSGHGHHRVDYRIAWNAAKKYFHFFMDFYLENPGGYYASSHAYHPGSLETVRAHVLVRDGSATAGQLLKVHDHAEGWPEYTAVRVPPTAGTLASTTNARQWWEQHRPVIVQTAAVGPVEAHSRSDGKTSYPGISLQGVRVFIVADDVIQRCHNVHMKEIAAAVAGTATLAWEAQYAPHHPPVPVHPHP